MKKYLISKLIRYGMPAIALILGLAIAFSIADAGGSSSGSALQVDIDDDDIIVDITQCDSSLVINDVDTLKKAFKGYSASSKLVQNAQYFLDHQNSTNVNAVFAAAVSITETSAGRAGHATDGKNNWYNIKIPGSNTYQTYSSNSEGIKAFFELISNNYFTHKPTPQISVRTIGTDPDAGENGHSYCEGASLEGHWSDNTIQYMKQMYSAAGIDVVTGGSASSTENSNDSSASSEEAEKVISYARKQLGKKYVYGASGPNTFDCSGLVLYCCKQAGVKKLPPRTTGDYPSTFGNKYKVSLDNLQPGDILWRHSGGGGHVGIYIGNGEFIHAPQTGDVVKISTVNGYGKFTCAYRPWK